jgi:hypothetical protein
MEKRRQHCQATSFSSDLYDVNFPVTVGKLCVSFWDSPEQYQSYLAKMITI